MLHSGLLPSRCKGASEQLTVCKLGAGGEMLVTLNRLDFFSAQPLNSEFVTELKSHLEKTRPDSILKKKSAAVMDLVKDFSPSSGLLSPRKNILSDALGKQSANNRVDFVFQSSDLGEFVPVEVAFNNREAVGTNFLKLEAFARHLDLRHRCPFGILVTPTRSLLEFGGWDAAYADNLEYEALRMNLYKPVLSLPVVIIELHGVF